MVDKTNVADDNKRKSDAEEFLATGLASLNLNGTGNETVVVTVNNNTINNNISNSNNNNVGGIGIGRSSYSVPVTSIGSAWNVSVGGSSNRFFNTASCFNTRFDRQNGFVRGNDAAVSSLSSSYSPRLHRNDNNLPNSSSSSSSSPSLLTQKQIFGNRQHMISSDTMIARLVNQMTAREREQVMLEIHGIADVVDESRPGFIESNLKLMDDEITRIRKISMNNGGEGGVSGGGGGGWGRSHGVPNMTSYEKAVRQNAEYVHSTEFRTLFLRASRFKPEAAVRRMIKFFEEKERLFGETSLCKPKTLLRDMSPKAVEILEQGGWQVLPQRDQGGRVILFCAGKLIKFRTDPDEVLAALQAFWKVSELTMQDVESQKRGTVIIVYQLGAGPNSGEELRGLQRIGQCFPQRLAALHACVDDATTKMVIDLSILMTGKDESRRYRCHSGSDVEVQYNLSTFGIPNRIFPVGPDGTIDKSDFLSFLRQLRALEDAEAAQSSRVSPSDEISCSSQGNNAARSSKIARFSNNTPTEFVMVPSQLDVLLGRGRGIQEHTGNIRCRNLVATYRDRYDAASKSEKTEIIRIIVEEVQKWGGRFMERSTDGPAWCVVSDEHARYKVSHGFRNHKRLTEQKKNVPLNVRWTTSPSEDGGTRAKIPSQKRVAGVDATGGVSEIPGLVSCTVLLQQSAGNTEELYSTKKIKLN